MSNFYGATSLIGGASGALDAIDGAALADLDGALVITDNKTYLMRLDADNAGGESSPLIIAPDDNPGDKRWVLNELVCAACSLGTGELTAGSINRATGTLTFEIGGTSQIQLADGSFDPTSDADIALGSHTKRYTQLYLSTVMGIGIDYAANGILEIGGGRFVFSDGGGAARAAMNFEANTAAIGYASINCYDYNGLAPYDLSINESGGRVCIGTATRAGTLRVYQKIVDAAIPVLQLDQLDIDDVFVNYVGTSAVDGSRSISSDATEEGNKVGAFRIEINGALKWVRFYDDES